MRTLPLFFGCKASIIRLAYDPKETFLNEVKVNAGLKEKAVIAKASPVKLVNTKRGFIKPTHIGT